MSEGVAPVLLAPDNFTSPARTPWGGRRIAGVIKAGLVPEPAIGGLIGESWELSQGPELPSRIDAQDRTLAQVIARDPAGWLGRELSLGGTALLVKLLDAGEALSVQIHPRDDDPKLAPGESGKPECWYIEHAEPGACLWIGWTQDADRDAVTRAIERGDDLSRLLNRTEVEAGDFIVVPPCTPHAIGAGVTLVEPQRVVPGRRGVTYRYWDWNRRYDRAGNLDPSGAPRELHAARAIEISDWSVRQAPLHRGGPPGLDHHLQITPLAGEGGVLESDALEVWRLAGSGHTELASHHSLRSITVLEGELHLRGLAHPEPLTIGRGRTAAVPAACGPLAIQGRRAHAIIAAARSASLEP